MIILLKTFSSENYGTRHRLISVRKRTQQRIKYRASRGRPVAVGIFSQSYKTAVFGEFGWNRSRITGRGTANRTLGLCCMFPERQS